MMSEIFKIIGQLLSLITLLIVVGFIAEYVGPNHPGIYKELAELLGDIDINGIIKSILGDVTSSLLNK